MPNWIYTQREVNGVTIPGTFIHAFVHNGAYFATEIKIYKDGMIDCWGLVDMEGFKKKVNQGWVVTQLPEGARVCVADTYFTVADVKQVPPIEESEFIKEVEDEIRELNGQLTSGRLCFQALEAYKREPSEATKETLHKMYEAVPKHKRKFLGSMDDMDSEYRMILGIK